MKGWLNSAWTGQGSALASGQLGDCIKEASMFQIGSMLDDSCVLIVNIDFLYLHTVIVMTANAIPPDTNEMNTIDTWSALIS
jgi:hypothetical protein